MSAQKAARDLPAGREPGARAARADCPEERHLRHARRACRAAAARRGRRGPESSRSSRTSSSTPSTRCPTAACSPSRLRPGRAAGRTNVDAPARDYVRVTVKDQGQGIDAGGARPRLRAILHDQRRRRRYGPRPLGGLRHRAGAWRVGSTSRAKLVKGAPSRSTCQGGTAHRERQNPDRRRRPRACASSSRRPSRAGGSRSAGVNVGGRGAGDLQGRGVRRRRHRSQHARHRTASSCAGGSPRTVPTCRSSWSPRSAAWTRRSPRSAPAPTTSSPSRSRSTRLKLALERAVQAPRAARRGEAAPPRRSPSAPGSRSSSAPAPR